MTDNIKNVIKAAIEKSGFRAFDDFESVDTLTYANDYLGFFAISNLELSRWVRSLDFKTYGNEISGYASVRLLGKHGIYDDYNELEEKINGFIERLGFSSQIIATSVKREEITENRILGRLEGQVGIGFKALITVSTLWEGA